MNPPSPLKLIFKDTTKDGVVIGHRTGQTYCHGATVAEHFEIDLSEGVPDVATVGSSGTG